MKKTRIFLLLLTILFGVVVAACDEDTQDDEQEEEFDFSGSVNATLAPLPSLNLVDVPCSEGIDDWFDSIPFRMEQFIIHAEEGVNVADDNQRLRMNTVLNDLTSERDQVLRGETPKCVEELTIEVANDMQDIILVFQQFANAEISSNELRQKALPLINELKSRRDTIDEDVEAYYE